MIELEHRGNYSIVRMARGKGNALNLDFINELSATLARLNESPGGAVVLTGTGSVFGAGVDLPALVEGGESYIRAFVPAMRSAFEQLATFPKPIVAAVNGHAIAGGAILMLACDQRLLARGSCRIGLTEVLVGVVFPAWALEIARFATPPEHFQTLICTGRVWNDEESLARGLVDELVDAEDLLERACAVAEELAAIPADTYAATKLAVRRPMIEAARQQTELEADSLIEHWCSPQVVAHVAEFARRMIKRKQ